MTPEDARRLATRVAKESDGVLVKFGKTNGRICLHLRQYPISETIYTEAEWDGHRLNRYNHKKSREEREERDTGLMAAVANKEAQ